MEIAGKKKKRLLKAIRICLLAAAVCVIFVFWYAYYSKNSRAYRESEKALDVAVARHLNLEGNPVKEPNELTEEDYEKIEYMLIGVYDFPTLKPFKKLKNLKHIKFVVEWGDMNMNLDFKPLARLEKFRELSFMVVSTDSLGIATTVKKKWYEGIISLMQKLRIRSNQKEIFDLRKLKKLKNLEVLKMGHMGTSNFEVLAGFTKMVELDIGGSKITNLKPISGLVNLEYLGLANTTIKNIDAIASLTNLKELDLGCTQITDIETVAKFTKLEKLHIHASKVRDISPIAKLNNLQTLDIYTTQISDITVLEGLTNIIELQIWNTKIRDISPLKNLKKLKSLALYNVNTSEDQIAELQKALPDLEILR